jgi:hypothetical protein
VCESDEAVDSNLTVISEDIIKVLRSGGQAERQAASDIYNECAQVIANSKYAASQVVLSRLHTLEDISKVQTRVVEQSSAQSARMKEMVEAKHRMFELFKEIKRHTNRGDLYSQKLLREITGIRDEMKKVTKAYSTSADIQRMFQEIVELHDTLTKSRAETPTPDSSEASDATSEGEDDLSPPAKVIRQYVSPYAVLGPSPVDPDETAIAAQQQRRSTRRVPKKRMSHQGASSAKALSHAAVSYLESLSANHEKKKETIERLSKLLPQITATTERRRINPVHPL